MRTINRTHHFPPATFAVKEAPEPKAFTTAFQCHAYSQGQWCLPYSVPVRRLRWATRSTT